MGAPTSSVTLPVTVRCAQDASPLSISTRLMSRNFLMCMYVYKKNENAVLGVQVIFLGGD